MFIVDSLNGFVLLANLCIFATSNFGGEILRMPHENITSGLCIELNYNVSILGQNLIWGAIGALSEHTNVLSLKWALSQKRN